MAQQWLCVFAGRAGQQARAIFPNKEQALQFAERHARSVALTGRPLKWEDAGPSKVLPTELGDYLITPTAESEMRG